MHDSTENCSQAREQSLIERHLPVLGLRPLCAAFSTRLNEPNPVKFTSLPAVTCTLVSPMHEDT